MKHDARPGQSVIDHKVRREVPNLIMLVGNESCVTGGMLCAVIFQILMQHTVFHIPVTGVTAAGNHLAGAEIVDHIAGIEGLFVNQLIVQQHRVQGGQNLMPCIFQLLLVRLGNTGLFLEGQVVEAIINIVILRLCHCFQIQRLNVLIQLLDVIRTFNHLIGEVDHCAFILYGNGNSTGSVLVELAIVHNHIQLNLYGVAVALVSEQPVILNIGNLTDVDFQVGNCLAVLVHDLQHGVLIGLTGGQCMQLHILGSGQAGYTAAQGAAILHSQHTLAIQVTTDTAAVHFQTQSVFLVGQKLDALNVQFFLGNAADLLAVTGQGDALGHIHGQNIALGAADSALNTKHSGITGRCCGQFRKVVGDGGLDAKLCRANAGTGVGQDPISHLPVGHIVKVPHRGQFLRGSADELIAGELPQVCGLVGVNGQVVKTHVANRLQTHSAAAGGAEGIGSQQAAVYIDVHDLAVHFHLHELPYVQFHGHVLSRQNCIGFAVL